MESPRKFMEQIRKDRYSDSFFVQEYEISKDELQYHFSMLSTKNKEKDFENFATAICKKLICPNIVPATGPYGGGDGKVDAYTYPVSKDITLYWGDKEVQDAGKENWAFAFSIKSDWKAKCEHDVNSILSTKRDFKKIFFVSNQLISSKKRADIFDKYKDKVEVRVLDLEWILSSVIDNRCINLVEEHLHIDCRKNITNALGPNDYQRNLRLKELEKVLEENKNNVELYQKNAIISLEIANLYCQLDRPFYEAKNKFNVAINLARKAGSKSLIKNVYYDLAWKMLYWYENYDEFFLALDVFKKEINNTHVIWDIERYSNLIVSILPAKDLPEYKEKTEKEIDEFLALLENINYEVETELFQVEVKTLYIQSKFILGNEEIENVVKTLNELFERGKHLVGYDSVTLLRCLEVFLNYIKEPLFFDFYKKVSEYSCNYLAGVDKAKNYMRLAHAYIKLDNAFDAIGVYGKAAMLFIGEDSTMELAECFCQIALLYERVGLYWASRSAILNGLYYISKEVLATGEYDPIFGHALLKLSKLELHFGRVIPFINSMTMAKWTIDKIVSSGYSHDIFEKELIYNECILLRLLFNTEFKDYDKINDYYSWFEYLELNQVTSLMEFLFNDDKVRLQEKFYKEQGEDINAIYSEIYNNCLPDLNNKINWFDKNDVVLKSQILGCEFSIKVQFDKHLIQIAEAILATLEGFFATFKRARIISAISKVEMFLVNIETEVGNVDFKDGIIKKVYIGVPGWEALKKNSKLFGDCVLEIILKIVENGFLYGIAEEDFEKLTKDDAIMERINYLHNYFVNDNFFGVDIYRLGELIKIKSNKLQLNRKKIWESNRKASANSEFNLDMQNHSNIQSYSIINIRLWDEAKWRGCVFGMFPYIPFVGFMFENFDAGKEIFSQWIDLLGREDKDNIIKLTIIKGISDTNPFAYKVAVSYNEQNIRTEGVLGLVTRFQRMDPSSSQNLDDFLTNQKRSGRFLLVPSYMQSGKPEIDSSQAILLNKINIIDAWQIDENSTLRCVIQEDDDIIIPKEHIEDAPVLKILEKL